VGVLSGAQRPDASQRRGRRRMARSSQRVPARLLPAATGRFAARPFVREDTRLVAAAYEPSATGQ